ncbi:glycoside hydrolase family 31 protein [Myxococcota bacterium]|nr:glycoside hydrolase family 31 protein [Myxococcota bacterium]
MKATPVLIALTCLTIAALAGCGDDVDPGLDVGGDVPADISTDLPDAADPDIIGGDVADGGDLLVTDAPIQECMDPPSSFVVHSGDWDLSFEEIDGTITIRRVDAVTPLMTLQMRDLQIGTVAAVDPLLTYDPYPMLTNDFSYTPPAGLKWLGLVPETCAGRRILTPHEDGVAKLGATFISDDCFSPDNGATCLKVSGTLRIENSGDGGFQFLVEVNQDDLKTVYFRVRPTVKASENFYGLGAYLDQVAHRGKIRAMQLEVDFDIESSYNEAHVPVPLLVSTNGWGIFVKSWYPGAFDCGVGDPERVDVVFGTGDGSGEGFQFYLYAADRPLDITRHYYRDTAQALLPARWGLGPIVWKDEVGGQAEVEADLRAIRDLDLATTAYWIDRPYASGVNAFDFHPDKFSNPQAMIDLAHDMGFRMALWHSPYISKGKNGDDESSPTTEALFTFAKENNYLVKNTAQLNKWGPPIDFTNPAAYQWFQDLIRQYTDMGIEGFKLDYGEDIVVGLLGLDGQNTQFFDGSTERTMHAKYQTFYHRIYAETLPADGGFLLCRRGVWGDQANVSVIWPGDLDANFATHRETVQTEDGSYVAVGGLPASVIYGLSLGVSGFPFFGSDTSGYRHSPPNREVFIRWMQQTALSSVMQVGNSSNTVPWDLASGTDLDVDFQNMYREFARLHLRLWPYEWTYAKSIATTGHPIQRPIGLVWPDAGVHPDDQYMFGEYLLVAPVVTEGAVGRDVYFPEGEWMDWFTGQVFEGPGTIHVDAALSKLPLYLARSGIVPMLRPTIDAIAPVAQEYPIDTYADDPGLLYVVVFAATSASSFELFDGARVEQSMSVDQLTVSIKAGAEFNSGAVFDIRGLPAGVTGVVVDGSSIGPAAASIEDFVASGGWFHTVDEFGGHLRVAVGPGDHTLTADLTGPAE